MAATYRYERVTEKLDGTLIVEVIVYDPVIRPEEQSWLVLEFAAGTTVNAINTKVANYANILANVARS